MGNGGSVAAKYKTEAASSTNADAAHSAADAGKSPSVPHAAASSGYVGANVAVDEGGTNLRAGERQGGYRRKRESGDEQPALAAPSFCRTSSNRPPLAPAAGPPLPAARATAPVPPVDAAPNRIARRQWSQIDSSRSKASPPGMPPLNTAAPATSSSSSAVGTNVARSSADSDGHAAWSPSPVARMASEYWTQQARRSNPTVQGSARPNGPRVENTSGNSFWNGESSPATTSTTTTAAWVTPADRSSGCSTVSSGCKAGSSARSDAVSSFGACKAVSFLPGEKC